MTVAITGAGPDGVPTVARCEECHDTWVRPVGDPSAATLPSWATTHQHVCPRCNGTGMDPLGDRPCDRCAGYGRHASQPAPAKACKQSGVLTMSRDPGERCPCPLCGRWLVITPEYRWPRHERARGKEKP